MISLKVRGIFVQIWSEKIPLSAHSILSIWLTWRAFTGVVIAGDKSLVWRFQHQTVGLQETFRESHWSWRSWSRWLSTRGPQDKSGVQRGMRLTPQTKVEFIDEDVLRDNWTILPPDLGGPPTKLMEDSSVIGPIIYVSRISSPSMMIYNIKMVTKASVLIRNHLRDLLGLLDQTN